MWLKRKLEIKRCKEEKREEGLQGNKVPKPIVLLHTLICRKVFHTNLVFKKIRQEFLSWNLFVNHHKQSSDWQLPFAKPFQSWGDSTAFTLPLIQTEFKENRGWTWSSMLWDGYFVEALVCDPYSSSSLNGQIAFYPLLFPALSHLTPTTLQPRRFHFV